MRKETTAEFLARGGKVNKILPLEVIEARKNSQFVLFNFLTLLKIHKRKYLRIMGFDIETTKFTITKHWKTYEETNSSQHSG